MPKSKARTTPLTQEQINAWFSAHLPYLRVALTNHIKLTTNPTLFGNMLESERHRVRVCTYEIGVLTCRKFIEFLGLSISYEPFELIEQRNYHKALSDGNSYEVKVIDLGGKWVEINSLKASERDLLKRIYLTGHRATVHLTDGSPYQGEWEIFNDGVELVDKLLKTHLYEIVGKSPSTQ